MKKTTISVLCLSLVLFTSCASIAAQFRIPNEKNIRIGMTEAELRQSIGIPIDKNRTMTDGVVRVQYVYRNDVYVYTENGIVIGWQD